MGKSCWRARLALTSFALFDISIKSSWKRSAYPIATSYNRKEKEKKKRKEKKRKKRREKKRKEKKRKEKKRREEDPDDDVRLGCWAFKQTAETCVSMRWLLSGKFESQRCFREHCTATHLWPKVLCNTYLLCCVIAVNCVRDIWLQLVMRALSFARNVSLKYCSVWTFQVIG